MCRLLSSLSFSALSPSSPSPLNVTHLPPQKLNTIMLPLISLTSSTSSSSTPSPRPSSPQEVRLLGDAIPAQADGDAAGVLPVSITAAPRAMRIVVP